MTDLNPCFSEEAHARKVRNGAFAAIATQAVRVATQAGSVIVLSRLLTPVDFGIYAMASPILAFAVLFQDLGLGHATVQKDSLSQSDLSSLFWVNLRSVRCWPFRWLQYLLSWACSTTSRSSLH